MATTAGDIYVRSGASGSFTSIEYVQGGWITVASASNMAAIYEDRLLDGQIIYVKSENQLYVASRFIAFETPGYGGFENSASFATFEFPSSGGTDLSALNSFTGSAQTSLDALNSATSSYLTEVPAGTISSSAQVELIITDAYISASAAASGFGSGEGVHTDITALNNFSGSAQAQIDALIAATSSYLTSETDSQTLSIVGDQLSISNGNTVTLPTGSTLPSGVISSSQQITDLGFISSSHTDISSLNTFTGSIQSEVDSLTAATSSYALITNVSGAFTSISGGFESRIVSLESIDLLGLNNFTGSAQTSLDALNSATSSYILVSQTSSLNVLSALTASFISDTFISASAAAAGFGTATDISALNAFTASANDDINTLYDTKLNTSSFNAFTSSVATTGSNTFEGNQQVNGWIDVTGYIITDDVLYTNAIEENTTNGGLTFVAGGFGFAFNNNIEVTGSIIATDFTGSLFGTSSWAENVLTASYIDPTFISASAAAAGFGSGGSTIPAGTVSSSAQILTNLFGQDLVVNTITAETYIVSSSITYMTTLFSSGSTMFGDSLGDTHQFTGSLLVLGNVEALSFTGSLFGTSSWAENSINALTASYINPSFITNIITDSYISASAAASGFGSGGVGGGIGTLQQVTDSGSFTTNAITASSFSGSMIVLSNMSTTPTAIGGAIFYSGSEFYFGIE